MVVMEAIGFPISREAACCGIYIYLGSTRVGIKSREQLRSDYLRMYEDSYKSGLERRRQRTLQQRARGDEASSPIGSSNVATAGSFLSMISGLSKPTTKTAVVIENDYQFEIGEKWVSPVCHLSQNSPKEEYEWVVNGVELFSISVEKTVDTVQKSTTDVSESLWAVESSSEDSWSDDDVWESVEEPIDIVNEGSDSAIDWEVSDIEEEEFIEDEKDLWKEPEPKNTMVETPVFVERRPEKETSREVGSTKSPTATKPKSFSEVKKAPEPTVSASVISSRLDEDSIRDFVKSHKLCSESDIFSVFSSHDRAKVRSVIKSALRKYKIFEKHGKFTV